MDLEIVVDPSSEPPVDFVVVRGLASFRGVTTGRSKPILSDSSWILHQLSSDFPGCRVSIFNYTERKPFETIFTRQGARAESLRLLDSLVSLKERKPKSSIVFIGHDVGGALIKEALVLAHQNLDKYENIFFSISAIVYLGCPHRWASANKLRTDLAKLLETDDSTEGIQEHIWELTRSLPGWIAETDCAFAETRLPTAAKIINVFSTHVNPLLRGFDEYTSTGSLPFEVHEPTKSLTHDEILLRGVVPEGLLKRVNFAFRDHENATTQHIQELAFQASPQFTLDAVPGDSPQLKEIKDHQVYLDWEKCQTLAFLSIRCPSRENATLVGNMLFCRLNVQTIESTSIVWLHFVFSPSDSRFNAVEVMLYTFLGQLTTQLCHCGQGVSLSEGLLEWYKMYSVFGALTLEDLFGLFYDMLLLLRSHDRGLGCVLSNLDQHITSCDWLMKTLSRLADECEINFKVLVVCSKEGPQSEHWAKWTQIHLSATEDQQDNPTRTACDDKSKDDSGDGKQNSHKSSYANDQEPCQVPDISGRFKRDSELLRLIQERPEAYELAPQIDGLLQACGEDDRLHRVILTWLRTRDSSSSSDNLIQAFSRLTDVTPEGCLKTIIDSIILPRSKRVESTLVLLRGAFRPLTVAELRDVWVVCGSSSAEGNDITNRSCLPFNTAAIFGGLLEIRRNEIQFAHPLLPGILSNPRNKPKETSEQVHQKITDLCLKYMTSPTGRATLKVEAQKAGKTGLESRHNFLAYAVRHWPHHAKLSGTEWQLNSPQITQFLDNHDVATAWASLYWGLTNPFSRGKIPSIRPEAIFARHGLGALLTLARNKETAPLANYELVELLEHASSTAQRDIVQDLLKLPFPENEKLDAVILAALQSEDEGIIAELVEFALMSAERVDNPQILLSRAASLGQINALKKLIPIVKQRDTLNNPVQGLSVLQHACSRGKSEAVETIMESDLVISDEDIWASLQLAGQFSNAETVGLLMDADIKRRQPDSERDYNGLLEVAIKSGRFSNLNAMLERLEPIGLKDKLDIALLAQAIEAKHIRCGEVLIDHIATSIDPKTPDFRSTVLQAIKGEMHTLWRQLLQGEGALSDGNLSFFLREGLSDKIELSIFEAMLDSASQQCSKEEMTHEVTIGIHAAILYDREDVTRLLIQNGADLEDKSIEENTALYLATYYGHVGCSRLLIDSKANVNACDDIEGWSILHAAYDNTEISRMLLAAGADVNAKDKKHSTPLSMAMRWGDVDTVKVLLEFEPSTESKQKALCEAVSEGAVASLRLLLDAGADPRKSPTGGCSELWDAVMTDDPAIVRLLLEFDIDLEGGKDSRGNSVLNMATWRITTDSDLSIIKLLVNRGSDIESKNNFGKTPLCQLVFGRNVEAARYFLSKGAEVNTKGDLNGGPLIRACHYSSLDMVRLLCEHDADIDITCGSIYACPLQAALYRGPSREKDDIITYLIKDAPRKANVHQSSPWWGVSLSLACLNCSVDIMQLMLDSGAVSDVNTPDVMGRTPIHFALYRSQEKVELLRGRGAELFEKDKMGRGPLHFAVLSGCLSLVRYVLEEGKDLDLVNERDIDGWTPLLWAMRHCAKWQTEKSFEFQRLDIIKELLSRGAELQVLGSGLDRTWSALKLSKFCGLSDEIIQLLESEGDWDSTSRTTREGQAIDEKWFCDACLAVGRRKPPPMLPS
ncbi:ankyrin repeat-containing domain protein [Hypoxylon crocopeplum]|nr:ankyrin repeat-containing domain protein [Hypoxylon crocopeplum]